MYNDAFSPQPQPSAVRGASTLQRYRLGLGIVALFTLFVVLAVLVMAGGAKQDAKTEKAANEAATKLEAYVNSKQAIPDSFSQAGVKNVPNTITYKKLSDNSYQFCATYKAASNGVDASGVMDVVSRGLYGVASSSDLGAGDTNSDFLYISPAHKKGANCQKITPYMVPSAAQQSSNSLDTITDPKQASIASGNQDTVCDISGYGTHYSGTIKSVTTASGQPIVPTVRQDIVLTITPNGSSPAGDQTLTLTSAGFNLFDSICTARDHASVTVGDYVSVFLGNSNQYMPGAIVDFSFKR